MDSNESTNDSNTGDQGSTSTAAPAVAGSVGELPANASKPSGVPAPHIDDVKAPTPENVHAGRVETHEKAEAERALGNGAEPARFNAGATE